jgi:hypothetical protein
VASDSRASAPSSEIGSATGYGGAGYSQAIPWQAFVQTGEYAPDLKWPQSTKVYDRMRTDAQVKGLMLGSVLPIRRFRWPLDPSNARPEVVEALAKDLNMPIKGEDEYHPGRRRNAFSFGDHLTDALLGLAYGFMYFETVGEIGADDKWHLTKLAPRHPRTIGQIFAEPNGDLVKVKQLFGIQTEDIPANRLVTYVWEQEAGSWVGTSMLRACYRDWLIKDELMRIDVTKHQRNGMGLPVGEAPPGGTQPEIDAMRQIAAEARSGELAGVGIPNGAKLTLQGVQGQLPDTVASMNFHNEEMARSFLMMFMQLGQTKSGSRALGSDFLDFFGFAQEAIADWVVDTFTEQVIEYWVDVNYGPDEPAPQLSYERAGGEDLAAQDLAMLIDKGAIQVDETLQNQIRRRYGFLPINPDEPPKPATPEPTAPAPVAASARKTRREVAAAADSDLKLPDRELRRQPYSQEIAAKVDYELMDGQVQSKIDALVATVKGKQAEQITELAAAIEDADGDLGKLASVEATPVFAEALEDSMSEMAAQGVEQAMGEAERQGITPKAPDLDTGGLINRANAVDTLLTRSLSEAAGRKAISLTAESGAVTPAEVATDVKTYLSGLSDQYLQEQLAGATVQAMNTGRKAVFAENPPKYLYASELLDENACEECVAIDGTEYESLEDAEADYPTGGYADCLGGPRCRGTLVAVHTDEAAPSQASAAMGEPGNLGGVVAAAGGAIAAAVA